MQIVCIDLMGNVSWTVIFPSPWYCLGCCLQCKFILEAYQITGRWLIYISMTYFNVRILNHIDSKVYHNNIDNQTVNSGAYCLKEMCLDITFDVTLNISVAFRCYAVIFEMKVLNCIEVDSDCNLHDLLTFLQNSCCGNTIFPFSQLNLQKYVLLISTF